MREETTTNCTTTIVENVLFKWERKHECTSFIPYIIARALDKNVRGTLLVTNLDHEVIAQSSNERCTSSKSPLRGRSRRKLKMGKKK